MTAPGGDIVTEICATLRRRCAAGTAVRIRPNVVRLLDDAESLEWARHRRRERTVQVLVLIAAAIALVIS